MPIYDYVCGNCGQSTEFIHGIEAPGPRFCPACGAEGTLRKAFAAPTVVFKGSGWAKKDRSGSSAGSTKARAGSDARSGDGATSTSGSSSGKDGGASSGAGGGSGESGSGSASGSGSGSASGSSTTTPKAGGSSGAGD